MIRTVVGAGLGMPAVVVGAEEYLGLCQSERFLALDQYGPGACIVESELGRWFDVNRQDYGTRCFPQPSAVILECGIDK